MGANVTVRVGDGAAATTTIRYERARQASLQMFYRFGIIVDVDLNIKDLDEAVGRRLREQASAAGMSVQQYLRNELTRIAARRSPAELAANRQPMSRSDFEQIRRRLREIDAA